MREMWIRFHEEELCQSLDTVFSFNEKGVEIWCRIEDEKSFQKLEELVAPLRNSHSVAIYATRPDPEKKSSDSKQPPPSFWNNAEIRDYLQDPFARHAPGRGITAPGPSSAERDSDIMLKQRLMMFAEQTLESGMRMRRYGLDLPALADAGFGGDADPQLKKRAAETARAHAAGLDKQAAQLIDNLSRALPKSSKRESGREGSQRRRVTSTLPADSANQLSDATRTVARRVYLFVHPQNHTVGLVDLREPSLLESLRTLRRMVSDFDRAIERAR
jgi:hypothetical protein